MVVVSRCLSAVGIGFSVILCPPGSWALLTVGLPDTRWACRTSTGLPRSARTSCDRGGRPLCPGDSGAHPDRGHFPAGARRFTATSPFPPPTVPPARMLLNEASTKGSRVFARPVFPSPVAARMERAALGLEPRASHPADQEPDDARRGGDRPSSTDLELHAQLTSVDLQSGSSLVMCDLASHVAKHSPGAGDRHDRGAANAFADDRMGRTRMRPQRPRFGRMAIRLAVRQASAILDE
jgi:hypothetical protein